MRYRETNTLGTAEFDKTSRQRGSELIGIADTIITDETIFAEDLGIIKIGLGAVKVWVQQAILTHVRRIGVKKPRLKCLCG